MPLLAALGEGGPVYLQIRDRLRHAIGNGEIAAGTRLPSSRALAADLGLSRSTVVAAYDQLIAEGYAQSRPGAGIFACDAGPMTGPTVAPVTGDGKTGEPGAPGPAWATPGPDRRRGQPGPAPTGHSDPPLALSPGLADLTLFPVRSWARTIGRVARSEPETLHHCPDRFGDPLLRLQIARYLLAWRGLRCDAAQVVITGGSGEALERALDLTCGGGATVGLEDPGYPPIRRFVQARPWGLRWLAIDENGAVVPRGRPAPRAVVLTPSHQFPLGGAMAQARRGAFLDWAHRTGGWIIEDDFDSDFRYAGRPIPALAALQGGDRVIYVGSFSKVFSHGLRLGYMVLPAPLVDPARQALHREAPRVSVTGQRPLARFMEDGSYLRHLRRVRRVYARRQRARPPRCASSARINSPWRRA